MSKEQKGNISEDAIVIFITTSNKEEAGKIANILIEERLAACVNIVERVRSIYRWKGEICDEAESLMVIKTKRGLFDKLSMRVKEVHSYTVPEIIALPIIEGSEEYMNWLITETA
ncbi:MAG: divalent-cation tolerance protein CutA [Nitrospirota bacterium]